MNIIDRITKTVSAKVSDISDSMWEKVEDVNNQLDAQAQYRFVCAVAKDEGVDYETALAYCTPHSPQWQPKYSLGYKMQAPYVTVMLSTKKGKEAFKKDLLPEELVLFDSEVSEMNINSLLHEEHRKQKKKEKKRKKDEKNRAFGLEVKSVRKGANKQ